MTRAPDEIVKLLHECERVARLSDRIVKVGPLNLGIDSALALLPVGGGLYTIGLGAWLLYMGHKRPPRRWCAWPPLSASTPSPPQYPCSAPLWICSSQGTSWPYAHCGPTLSAASARSRPRTL